AQPPAIDIVEQRREVVPRGPWRPTGIVCHGNAPPQYRRTATTHHNTPAARPTRDTANHV
ncbi:MAG: hypothetical protein ACRDGH_12175, partial [Candidatus Limnocylindria bacterium]